MSADTNAIRDALFDPETVARLLGLEGGARRQARSGLLVDCPRHGPERTPSCSLSIGPDATLRVHCFAGCGLDGDIFTLVAAVERLDPKRDFRAVFLRAAELAGIEMTNPRRDTPPPPQPFRRAPVEPQPSYFEDLRYCARKALVGDVANYLVKRGLLEQARIDGWGALPSLAKVRSHLKMTQTVLATTGLVLPSGDGWTYSGHQLVIPWRDRENRVTAIQRRRIDESDPRYVLAGRVVDPYGVDRFVRAPKDAPVAFVEGAADVLALRALAPLGLGPDVVVLGVPGVGGWRHEWAKFASGRVALLAFDGDDAGDAASVSICDALIDAGAVRLERRRPVGDWCDELARQVPPGYPMHR